MPKFIIDDSSHSSSYDDPMKGKGLVDDPYKDAPCSFIQKVNIPLIPRYEWGPRIEEMVKTRTRLSDLFRQQKIRVKDQKQTYLCWAFGTTTAKEIIRGVQGESYVSLSPGSVATICTGGRMRGGYPKEFIEVDAERGQCLSEDWEDTSLRGTDTPEKRKRYMTLEWFSLTAGNFDEQMTLLLNRFPIGMIHPWWGHLTCITDPTQYGKDDFGCGGYNSWGISYGNQGFFELRGQKAVNGGGVAPKAVVSHDD